MRSWYSKCLSEDLEIPAGGLHKPFAFPRPRAWINNKCISAGVSLQTYSTQMPTCSDIKCPKCHRPKLKRVVFSLTLFFFSSFLIFFLAWLSITSVIHTAAGWTGTLYNLANMTVVLCRRAQRSSQIFMSPKICHLLVTLHLPRAKGCGLVLLGGNVAFPLRMSHRDPVLPISFPACTLGITGNINSCRLAAPRIFWQVFLCPVISLLLQSKYLPFSYLVPPLHPTGCGVSVQSSAACAGS